MGIDQVAQVGDIVGKAVDNRAGKIESKHSTFNIQHSTSKGKIAARLNELEKNRATADHEKEESLRGTEKFGKTKTVVGHNHSAHPQSALPHSLDVTARPVFIPDFATPRFRLTPKHFAYLKIAEGCNHPCSFCIIPRMRGSHRSRTQADIVAEAKALIADGVKEINLISQDSTYYGLDLRPNHQPRHFVAGEIFRRRQIAGRRCHDHLHAAARTEFAQGRFLDSPALHASGALDGRT